MSFYMPAATRRMARVGAPLCWSQSALLNCRAAFVLRARLKSGSARSPARKSDGPDREPATLVTSSLQGKRSPEIDLKKRAEPVLSQLRKSSGEASKSNQSKLSERDKVARPATLGVSEKELRSIANERRRVLWPGVWTLFALIGTYGTLAYLDVKAGVPSSDGSHLPERAQLPQSWCLTPAVIREGIVAGWKELDSLTIGIVATSAAIYLLRRSPLPIWKKLIRVTGETKWTTFTYPFVNSSWTRLVANMTALVWFLPGVVHYFDGDFFHTSAFLVSVPLTMSYLARFGHRFNLTKARVLNIGASSAVIAAFGIYCVAYAKEKVWVPIGLVLRLDAREWGLIFALFQAYNLTQISKGGNRHVHLLHLASFALGLAYAHFNLKHHLWIPLVSEISSTQDSSIEIEQ